MPNASLISRAHARSSAIGHRARRYCTFKARLANREELTRDLDAALSTRTTEEWMAQLGGLVPASPVYDIAEALNNPFVREGGRVAAFTRPEGGDPVQGLVGPVRIDARRHQPWRLRRSAPIPITCWGNWAFRQRQSQRSRQKKSSDHGVAVEEDHGVAVEEEVRRGVGHRADLLRAGARFGPRDVGGEGLGHHLGGRAVGWRLAHRCK
jgi:hypothetical protein